MNDLFYERMKDIYLDRYDEFKKKLDEEPIKTFFYNTLKEDKEKITALIDFKIVSSKLNEACAYYEDVQIGKTIVNDLGLIYPQELSATLPAKVLDPKGDVLIVDMCAAPGGKSIDLLNINKEQGLLISNEYEFKRAEALVSNLERIGGASVIITNKDTRTLSEELSGRADYVLLDAPCSGEGMARKNKDIISHYSLNNVLKCATLQKELLDDAYRLLKQGGYLVYSTCTYAKEENEDNVSAFLSKHPDMELLKIDLGEDLYRLNYPKISDKVIRLSPLNNTEGQFIALFKKHGESVPAKVKYLKSVSHKLVESFIKEQLDLDKYYLYELKDRYYLSLRPLYDLKDKVIRYGIYAGELKKNIFLPSHHFYRIASLKDRYKKVLELDDEEYLKYRKGQSIFKDVSNGYWALFYKGEPFSFTKVVNKELKNKYPKGLRY